MAELVKVCSAAIYPATPVKTGNEVTKLVKTVEKSSQAVIDRTSTSATNRATC